MRREQALASLQAFLPNDNEIVKIINFCDLDPINPDNWRIWGNEYSFFIKVKKNKKLLISWQEEDFLAPKKDLYAYANIKDVANISKTLLFIAEEDIAEDNYCFSFLFLGKDEKLRYRRYVKNIYRNDPPLSLSIDDIRTLIKNENINGYKPVLSNKKNAKAWITSWPPKSDFYQETKKEIKICKDLQVDLLILGFLV